MNIVILVMLIICIILIIVISSTAYLNYEKTFEKINSGYEQGNDSENVEGYIFGELVDEKGFIYIDGEKFNPYNKKYGFLDYFELGLKFLNKEMISISINEEEELFKEYKLVIISATFLFIYWIILLLIYEKEDKMDSNYIGILDQEIFKKYNPLIAGCIEGNRRAIHRDVIATILELKNKKIIDLKLEPINEEDKTYKYILIRNKKNEVNIEMDEVERYIHKWVFGTAPYDKDEVDLMKFIDEMASDKNYNKKIKELNKIAKRKLNKIGANKNKVPIIIKVLNVIFFIGSALIFITSVCKTPILTNIGTTDVLLIYITVMLFAVVLPIIVFLLYTCILLFIQSRRIVKIVVGEIASKKIIEIIILVAAMLIIMIIVTLAFSWSPRLIAYEALLCISMLIMKTDDFMIKNDKIILKDYVKLKKMKEKIENYTILNKREIEEIELWENYMTYAIAFGVAKNIVKNTNKKTKKIAINKEYLKDLVITTLDTYLRNY